jgi:sigma-B regulation protein RsbU (phosphoserine phosphatase)
MEYQYNLRKYIENILFIIFGFALFSIINVLLVPLFTHSYLIAFLITIIILVLNFDRISLFLTKHLIKNYFIIISEAEKSLEKLNDNLNRSVRYHEITKIISETFDIILENIPYAFYILENNRFYLTHYGNLDSQSEILRTNLKSECFKIISREKMVYNDIAKLNMDKTIVSLFINAGLNSIFPFWGHEEIFALLFTDASKVKIIKDTSTKNLFEKIQKKAGLILENSALFIDLEKKNFETAKIIEVSQKILSSLDMKNILDFILDSLQKIIQFDAASIFLLDESGKILLSTSSIGYENSLGDKLHLKVGEGACGWVVQTKQVDVLDDVRVAEHYCELRPKTHSQISIPLLFDNKVLGVICVESNQIAYFTDNLVEVLKLFAHLAAIAIHNARQFEVMLAKQALEHELVNASAVQQRLLVHQFPKIYNLSLTAENIASKIVSGDIYDFIKLDDKVLCLAIGDVSGKGAPAALMMTLILAGLRSQNKLNSSVKHIVYQINDLLYDSISRNKFASFFYAQINMNTDSIIYSNAGHNPPILIRANGTVNTLSKGGIVLGYMQNFIYEQDEIKFKSGDILAAYTDGVTETLNHKDEEFGEARLIDILVRHRNKTVDQIQKIVIQALKEFSDNTNPIDDITLIICKHE